MGRYDHLPIYRLAVELTVFLERAVRGFSRYHKYSIGQKLRESSWDVVSLVMRANNTPTSARRPILLALRDKIEEVSISLTISKELQAFTNQNSWQHAARMAVDLGRQSEGWLKSLSQPSSPES